MPINICGGAWPEASLACGLLDAVDALDERQPFGCEAATIADRLCLQRLIELAPCMRETADVHDALALADRIIAAEAVALQVALEVLRQPPGDLA